MMRATVAVCTRNRSESLKNMLRSLERMPAVNCDWELLVVDNGSSDRTQEVISDFNGRLPIRTEIETCAGLSNARNRAVLEARGEYIIWTDDDVVVDPGWLAAYISGFSHWPDASIFGGLIVPVLEQPCIAWFREVVPFLGPALAARDLGDAPAPLSAEGNRIPFGANFAVRMEEQRRFPYDPTLGVGPGSVHGGEETTVVLAMLAAGHVGRWLPDSRVDHIIGLDRQTTAYIGRYFETLARTAALQGEQLSGKRLGGVPRWLWRRLIKRRIAYEAARRWAPPKVWVPCLIDLAQDRGRIRHFRSLHR